MSKQVPTRIRAEVVVAVVSSVLGLVTLVWRDWIEVVFRVDPDHGDGAAEWLVVTGLFVVAAASFLLSRWELRRLATSASL